MTSITFMILLGFVDDVIDLRWRYKLIIPTVGTLPLLVAYTGITQVVIPRPVRFIFGRIVDLGALMIFSSFFHRHSS